MLRARKLYWLWIFGQSEKYRTRGRNFEWGSRNLWNLLQLLLLWTNYLILAHRVGCLSLVRSLEDKQWKPFQSRANQLLKHQLGLKHYFAKQCIRRELRCHRSAKVWIGSVRTVVQAQHWNTSLWFHLSTKLDLKSRNLVRLSLLYFRASIHSAWGKTLLSYSCRVCSRPALWV